MAHVPKREANGGRTQSTPAAGPRSPAQGGTEEEKKLVRRAQGGDALAYEELVRGHQQRIFAVVGGILRRREDIEDVAQQVFMKAYFSLRRFDLRSAFGTWLYKIAVNECWDYLRKKRVRRLVYEADLSEEQVRQLDHTPNPGGGAQNPGEDAGRRAEQRDLRSEEHTSELQSLAYLVCRLLLEKKKSPTRSSCPRWPRCSIGPAPAMSRPAHHSSPARAAG